MRSFAKLGAIGFSWFIATSAFSQGNENSKEIVGEILKLSPKRTVVVVDLAGDADVTEGTEVKVFVEGKERSGTIKTVAKTGKAMIKLNKGLPSKVKKGDTIAIRIENANEAPNSSQSVRLVKGFRNKAYWDDISYLATHRRSGARSDIEVGYLNTQGARESSGGTQSADIEYEYAEKSTSANGGFGWVGRGGIGGGVLFDYLSSKRELSASVDTESTGTLDTIEDVFERKVTNVTPYLGFLSRAKTGDLGFGAGIGFLIRNSETDYAVKDGGDEFNPEKAKVTQAGPTFELMKGTNTWAFIAQINPGIKGKEKQAGFDEVERTSSEFGAHFETYGDSLKSRIGLIYFGDKGESADIKQKDTGMKFSSRLDFDMRTFHLVPFFDFTRIKRQLDVAEGTQTTADFGTRFAKSGVLAPFVAVGVSIINEKQSGDKIPDLKTSAGGFKIAGGISI